MKPNDRGNLAVKSHDHLQRLREADLNLLLILSVLLTTRGVSKTAEKLSLSQPAVSRTLDRLRQVFDDRLLVRSGNLLVLTPKARDLLPLVEEFMDSALRILSPSEADGPTAFDREVRIGCSEYVQITIARIFPKLQRMAPGLKINFVPMLQTELANEALASGSLDLMIGMMTDVLALLRIEHLYLEPFVCLLKVPEGQPQPMGLEFSDFCRLPHLDVSPTGRRVLGARIDSTARQLGGVRTVSATISSFMAAPQIVADTGMLCLVPQRIGHLIPRPQGVVVVDLLFPPPALDIVMYWHNVTQTDPVCQWLRQQFALEFAA